MPNTKVIIAAAGLVGLVVLLVLVIVFTHNAAGIAQKCPPEVQQCPEKEQLYHVGSGKCFRKGETPEGICTRNMAISQVSSCRKQGICECDYNAHERWLIFHNETNQCYFVYTQGYCEPGEWLEISKSGIVCSPNICLKEIEANPGQDPGNYVPFNNSCQRLFSTSIPGCKELKFYKGKSKPLCSKPPLVDSGGVGAIPSAECPAGSFQAVNGHCQPRIEFDFGD